MTAQGFELTSQRQKVSRLPTEEPTGRSCELQTPLFFFFFFFFNLTYSRWTSSLPSCLWSQRIFPSLPGSCLTTFLSRCKFSTLTTRQPMVEFYLLTFPRFPLRKKERKSYFGKNRTHDFRTRRCADYLLDHSDDVNNRVLPREIAQAVMAPTAIVSSWVGNVGKELRRDEPVIFVLFGASKPKRTTGNLRSMHVFRGYLRDNHCSTNVLSTVLPPFCVSSV